MRPDSSGVQAGDYKDSGGQDGSLDERLARVRLVVLDVDGVLTDGRIRYAGEDELMQFDVKDGLGLVLLRRAGVALAWISGRGCEATEKRARELGVEELHLRSGPKGVVLEGVQRRLGVAVEQTLAMGDDLPDLELAERAGVFVAPADGVPALCERADWVTRAGGGRGAVREVADRILAAKGKAESTGG